MTRLITIGLLIIAGCGNITGNQHDAAVPHDAAIDSPDSDLPDPEPTPPREARELVSGGTRMMGATYTLDVQVGHSVQQGKIMGPTYKLEGNAAVKP